jgi:hypothetical protein
MISSIKIELNCFGINTENIQLTELICDQIASFCSNKMKEISPNYKGNVKIDKYYIYEKEKSDEQW